MSAMAKSPGGFRAALLIGWILLSASGFVYARVKGIPGWAALPVVAAFLVEYPFYLAAGFPEARERLAGRLLPAWLLVAVVLPYLVCCLGAVPFAWLSLVRLAAIAIGWGLWYVVLPPTPVVDLAFLALTGAVSLGGYFDTVYPVVFHEHLATLGRIALFVSAILVLMLDRRVPETGFGFLPRAQEWRIGALHFLYFLPVALPLAILLKAAHFIHPRPLVGALNFVGFLLVIGLCEEFFFRGVLQQWIEAWTGSSSMALLLASLAFGLVHYFYRGWPWVPLAAVLGWFCGRARNRAGSIRASAVTHALVVAAFRTFLA